MGRWLLLLAVAALPIAVYAWRASNDAGAEGKAGGAAATRRDPEAANLYHLYVMPLRGGTARAVPDPRGNPYLTFDPAWSPDGRLLAVTETDCHQCAPEVRLVDLDQTRANRTTIAAGSQPSFAPDGRRLTFVPGNGGLATISADGGSPRVLLEDDRRTAETRQLVGCGEARRSRSDHEDGGRRAVRSRPD
jgi:Tol biopolymer transport system component